MNLDATVRARLEAAAADQDIPAENKSARAEKVIWAAVALSAGMGVVPFGINIGFFLAVSGGLVICLGELYGYTYTKREAAALVVRLFKSCGWTWTASAFGLKFMAEVLKGAGVITMGGATPVGMALDATLSEPLPMPSDSRRCGIWNKTESSRLRRCGASSGRDSRRAGRHCASRHTSAAPNSAPNSGHATTQLRASSRKARTTCASRRSSAAPNSAPNSGHATTQPRAD
jgi:uncharacterized protein (DUF697 family)